MPYRMPERRRRVRILTLKNFGIAGLAALVLLVAVNFLSEIRGKHHGEFGALFDKQVKTETVEPRKVEVVTEAPAQIQDHDSADPMLLAPAARQQQYLGTNEITPRTQVVPVPQQPQPLQPSADRGRVAIVGDEHGVSVVSPRHVLAGGFGR